MILLCCCTKVILKIQNAGHAVTVWLQDVMKVTYQRHSSCAHEVMSGQQAAPIRQVVSRPLMDWKWQFLSSGWQMWIKYTDKEGTGWWYSVDETGCEKIFNTQLLLEWVYHWNALMAFTVKVNMKSAVIILRQDYTAQKV